MVVSDLVPGRVFGLVRSVAVLALLAAVGLGCGGGADPNDPSSRNLSPYAGRQAELFDDAIEPSAVGLDFDKGYAPRTDRTLRERAQVGDAVVRVRVSTVTTKTDGPDAVYQLGLHTVERIAGTHAPPTDFTVSVRKASAAHGILKNFESRLVGYPFVAFVRLFAQPSGDPELHFHFAPDTKDVKGAVDEAMALGQLNK